MEEELREEKMEVMERPPSRRGPPGAPPKGKQSSAVNAVRRQLAEAGKEELKEQRKKKKKKKKTATEVSEQRDSGEEEQEMKKRKKKKKKKSKSESEPATLDADERLEEDGAGEDGERKKKKKKKKKKKEESIEEGHDGAADESKERKKKKKKKKKKSKDVEGESSQRRRASADDDRNDVEEETKLEEESEENAPGSDNNDDKEEVGFAARTRVDNEIDRLIENFGSRNVVKDTSENTSASSKNNDNRSDVEAEQEQHPMEDDLLEEDLDTEFKAKEEDQDDEELQGFATEEADLTLQYIDEFAAVQNPDRDMSERISRLRDLLYNPVPEGVTFSCQIDRHYDNSGNVYYSFILPVERGDGMRDKRMTLMIAKSRSGVHLKQTYVISLEPIDFRKRCSSRSERYFGKLQLVSGLDAALMGSPTQYLLFDDGYNPRKVPKQPPIGVARKELASILFSEGRTVPEDLKMSVALPRKSREPDCDAQSHLKSLGQNHRYSVTERLIEGLDDVPDHPFLQAADKTQIPVRNIPIGNKKRPALSQESRFPVAPSSKNFELGTAPVLSSSQPQCGMVRIGKERFFCLTRYPLSPFESFGVCIAKFDSANSYRSKISRRFSA